MSETWADTALFTLPFRALIARCFGTVEAPHLQSLLSQSQGKGQLSLTGIPSGLSVREEIVTWAAQADTHLKPSQFNEAQHVDSNKSCLSLFPLAEPLPSFVGWDYSAGGAGDGAGENLFVKKSCLLWAFYSFQHFAWIYLVWMSNTMLDDGIVLAVPFLKPSSFHAL